MSWLADAFDDGDSDDNEGGGAEEIEQIEEEEPPKPKRRNSRKDKAFTSARTQQNNEKKTRQRYVLNKEEKLSVTTHILALKGEEVTVKCLSNAVKQLSPVNDSLKQFSESLIPSQLIFLVRHLQESFVRIYSECSTLKERYLQFQLKWHEYCSYFLATKNSELSDIGLHPSDPIANKVITIRSEWRKVCNACSVDDKTSRTFCISFFGSVYDEFLRQCQVAIKPETPVPPEPEVDSDDVYYRFGGGTIAAMLKTRYSKIQSSNCTNKDQVSMEITILQKLSVHLPQEKSHIPEYLKYRDDGYMYFPCPEMLPFLKAVDVKTKKHANSESFTELGVDLLKKIGESMENDSELLTIFAAMLLAKVPEATVLQFKQLNGIFAELVRKLCHTRVQEFLDSYKQSVASKQGTATLKGLNLRDSLLGHHVNLKKTD